MFTRSSMLAVVLLATTTGPTTAAEPTAHDPQFGNAAVWGDGVRETDFVKQDWPKARLLVWAHVGENVRGLDFNDPAQWRTADGRPATAGPDKNTDLMFPDGKYNAIGAKNVPIDCRHLTVGKGVRVALRSIHAHGNVWLRGGVSGVSQVKPRGPANVFWRNDHSEPISIANKIVLNKPVGRSIEFIGQWKTGDELNLFSGTMIVGRGSTFMPGDRSIQRIYPDATLVLLSGSTFHKRGNQYHMDDIMVRGALLAGTPDRTLTEDARLGLSFKSRGMGYESPSRGSANDRGLVVFPEGKLVVHSADPDKAKLVFFWHRQPVHSFKPNRDLDRIESLPHGVDMLLLGDIDLNGVAFNDMLNGGVILRDRAMRDRIRNVRMGEGNFGSLDELFTVYEGGHDLDLGSTNNIRPLMDDE